MGVKLINEVMEHAPAELSPTERLLLIVLAETANDQTRRGWLGMDRLRRRSGLAESTVRNVVTRLAKITLIERIPVGKDRAGRPVYAHRGHAVEFRIGSLGCSNIAEEGARTEAPSDPGKALDVERLPEEKGARYRDGRRSLQGSKALASERPSVREPSENRHIRAGEREQERSAVVAALFERTGKKITDERHTDRVIAQLVGDRTGIKNRLAYLRGAIARDPTPERFLPTPTPPRFRPEPPHAD